MIAGKFSKNEAFQRTLDHFNFQMSKVRRSSSFEHNCKFRYRCLVRSNMHDKVSITVRLEHPGKVNSTADAKAQKHRQRKAQSAPNPRSAVLLTISYYYAEGINTMHVR